MLFSVSPSSDERQGAEAASLAVIYGTSSELCVAILLLESQIIFYFVQEIMSLPKCEKEGGAWNVSWSLAKSCVIGHMSVFTANRASQLYNSADCSRT